MTDSSPPAHSSTSSSSPAAPALTPTTSSSDNVMELDCPSSPMDSESTAPSTSPGPTIATGTSAAASTSAPCSVSREDAAVHALCTELGIAVDLPSARRVFALLLAVPAEHYMSALATAIGTLTRDIEKDFRVRSEAFFSAFELYNRLHYTSWTKGSAIICNLNFECLKTEVEVLTLASPSAIISSLNFLNCLRHFTSKVEVYKCFTPIRDYSRDTVCSS